MAKQSALQRLTPAEFRAAAYAKGWTLRALAERWGMSPESVYRMVSNSDRAAYADDAIRGLPRIGRPLRPLPHWSAGKATSKASAPHISQAEVLRRSAPGMRYHGYMVLGAVVAVSKDLGSVAEECMRGIVVKVEIAQRGTETYRVVFETGELESFDADLVDEYLVTSGLERDEIRDYVYVCDEQVRADFDAGKFEFEDALA